MFSSVRVVLVAVACSGLARAIVPFAGQDVLFSIGKTCITALINDENAPITAQSCTTSTSDQRIFTVVAGGAAAGQDKGPIGQIRIYDNQCLSVPDGVNTPGTKLVLTVCDETGADANQLWRVNPDLSIQWAGHNQCVDLTNGSQAPGTPVQIWTCVKKSSKQSWTVVKPNVLIEARLQSGYCVTPASTTLSNGLAVISSPCGSNSWDVPTPYGTTTGPIKIGSKCLDVTNGVNKSGTKVQLWDCVKGNTNQLWRVVEDGGTLEWVGKGSTGKCLDFTDGKPGKQLQIWTCNSNSHQQWVYRDQSVSG